jgi:hypothetical protein
MPARTTHGDSTCNTTRDTRAEAFSGQRLMSAANETREWLQTNQQTMDAVDLQVAPAESSDECTMQIGTTTKAFVYLELRGGLIASCDRGAARRMFDEN